MLDWLIRWALGHHNRVSDWIVGFAYRHDHISHYEMLTYHDMA